MLLTELATLDDTEELASTLDVLELMLLERREDEERLDCRLEEEETALELIELLEDAEVIDELLSEEATDTDEELSTEEGTDEPDAWLG